MVETRACLNTDGKIQYCKSPYNWEGKPAHMEVWLKKNNYKIKLIAFLFYSPINLTTYINSRN